ncbi:MAG: glycosyltransferase family 2 protein [Planctomycetota bacterium]|jgi:glycosyltransferase involved in cell wall biosynthesis|nr:glycosyltransferase family 2 protein [Planctomycetota bacterium]
MQTTLVVTTFNRPSALRLALLSIARQETLPFEVIVADDGSSPETGEMVTAMAADFPVPLRYSWQENAGFRLSLSRNRAIAKTSGDYIVMMDGDLILHPRFIRDHQRVGRKNTLVQGIRIRLEERETERILENGLIHPDSFSPYYRWHYNAWRLPWVWGIPGRPWIARDHFKGTKGCNMGFFRKDCLAVNGFDENFQTYGGEDNDFTRRLIAYGIRRKFLRFGAIAWHLWHPSQATPPLSRREKYLLSLQTADPDSPPEKIYRAENGIDKHLSPELLTPASPGTTPQDHL